MKQDTTDIKMAKSKYNIKKQANELKEHLKNCWMGYTIGFIGYGLIISGLINKDSETAYAGLVTAGVGGAIGSFQDNKKDLTSKLCD